MRTVRFVSLLLMVITGVAIAGCSLLTPLPPQRSTSERLEAIPVLRAPLSQGIEIRWDKYQVPMVVAQSDADLAFGLGLVHAHLRLGQMKLFRLALSGRLSEVAGPLAVDIDHALRLLDFRRAVPAMKAGLPAETKVFLERFVEGINYYQRNTSQQPFEDKFLGLSEEPWTIDDILALSRLAGTEVNWLFWVRLLPLTTEPQWEVFWRRLLSRGAESLPSFRSEDAPLGFLGDVSKSGSNSFVVSGSRSATGGTLIANDPHVGLQLPNLWLLAAVHSPSYRAVGLMFPGVPGVLLGRNENIAWGGTNMLSVTSSLAAVSEETLQRARVRKSAVGVRWWFDSEIAMRSVDIPLGQDLPILTDSKLFESYTGPALALRWRGHEASDEISAFLRVMAAGSWPEFRAAFSSYAVSGQNFLYADTKGSIGQVMAVQLPEVDADYVSGFVVGENARWKQIYGSESLPYAYNPSEGFLVSANNQPYSRQTTLPRVGLFAASNDRIERIQGLLKEKLDQKQVLALSDLASIQRDVVSPSSVRLLGLLGPTLESSSHPWAALLRTWNGEFSAESQAPSAWHRVLYHLVMELYTPRFGDAITKYLLSSEAVYSFLEEDLAALSGPERGELLASVFRKLPTEPAEPWGEFHRIRLQHPFGNIPVLGRAFRFGELAASGSASTVAKTFSGLTDEVHSAAYGANSRHLSDLSDQDENYFVLLGGQDGFFGSANFLDQTELWQRGETLRVPLTLAGWDSQMRYRCVVGGDAPKPCAAR